MRISEHVEKIAAGTLAGVCLLLLPNLIGEYAGSRAPVARMDVTRRQAARPQTARARPTRQSPPSDSRVAKVRSVVSHHSTFAPKHHMVRSEAPTRAASRVQPTPIAAAQPVPAPLPSEATAPVTSTLTPLGYVQKADGSVEAVVADGEHVQVVHVGEILADKYKVLKISPSAVEVADLASVPAISPVKTPPVEEVNLMAEARPKASAPTGGAWPEAPTYQKASPSADDPSVAASKAVGYVEKAGGEVVSVLADGEHVRLVPQAPVLAANSKVYPLEVARKAFSPTPTGGSAGPRAEFASGQGAVVSAVPESSSFQTVALRRTTTLEGAISFGGQDSPVYCTTAAESAVTPQPAAQVPKVLGTAAGSDRGAEKSAALHPASLTLRPIGYVQKMDGEVEAVVDHGDQVYIVRQGEVFAARFKALAVSPQAVVVADLTIQPAQRRDPPQLLAEEVQPRASALWAADWRSPPRNVPRQKGLRRLRKAAGLDPPGAAESAKRTRVRPRRAPPFKLRAARAQVESRLRDSAANPREKCALSPPTVTVLKPLGYVEEADGRFEAIVANGDSVYLVQNGDVFADRFKVVGISSSFVEVVKVAPGQLVPAVNHGPNILTAGQLIPPRTRILRVSAPPVGAGTGARFPDLTSMEESPPEGRNKRSNERAAKRLDLNLPAPIPDNGGVPR
jgi:hypothetical protein